MRREGRKTGKLVKNRGFTDKLYFYNFCAVHILMAAILAITAMGGLLGLVDLSPLGSIPQWAYAELGIHTGFVIWKAKAENARKYPAGRDGVAKPEDPAEPGGADDIAQTADTVEPDGTSGANSVAQREDPAETDDTTKAMEGFLEDFEESEADV